MDSQGKHSYMLKWEQALGEELSTEQCKIIWSRAAKSPICTLYEENTYKVLSFWYMTPTRLHAIYPPVLDCCWRCRRDRGTLLHIYWQYPSLQPSPPSTIRCRYPPHPKMYLLGLLHPKLPRIAKKLTSHMLLLIINGIRLRLGDIYSLNLSCCYQIEGPQQIKVFVT